MIFQLRASALGLFTWNSIPYCGCSYSGTYMKALSWSLEMNAVSVVSVHGLVKYWRHNPHNRTPLFCCHSGRNGSLGKLFFHKMIKKEKR